MLPSIPCTLMRGGTSKGPYFHASDLPADPAARNQLLLAAMGSPHVRQIDGIGGGDTLTSKVVIVSPSTRPGIDIDYLFAQVSVETAGQSHEFKQDEVRRAAHGIRQKSPQSTDAL